MAENKRESILIIDELNSMAPSSNGINNIIYDFVKFGSGLFEISMAGLGQKDEVGRWTNLQVAGIKVLYFTLGSSKGLRKSRLLKSIPTSLFLIFGLLRFRRKIELGSVDFVQAHRIEIGAFLIRAFGIRPVQLIHNAKQNLTGKNSDSFWKRIPKVYSFLEKASLQGSRSVGVFNLEESLRLSNEKAGVLRCRTWFDQTYFNIGSLPNDAEDGRHKIVWVGRLDEQKDPERAVKVFAELLSSLPQAELHIFGEGPLRQKTENLCHSLNLESVFFHGSVPKAHLANYYKSGSTLLMTSHYEGSPTVLVEALGCGLPAVVNVGSDPDVLIKNGLNGMRLQNTSESEMADAIRECISLDPASVALSVEDRSAQALCLKTLIALHSKLNG